MKPPLAATFQVESDETESCQRDVGRGSSGHGRAAGALLVHLRSAGETESCRSCRWLPVRRGGGGRRRAVGALLVDLRSVGKTWGVAAVAVDELPEFSLLTRAAPASRRAAGAAGGCR